MSKHLIATLIALASITATAATPPATPAPTTHPAKTPAQAAVKAQPELPLTYDDAEVHVGDKIIVHTVNKTTRMGVLTKFSKTMLTMNVDVPGGTVEFTFDKGQVAGLGLPIVPQEAAKPDTGTPSAKKN